MGGRNLACERQGRARETRTDRPRRYRSGILRRPPIHRMPAAQRRHLLRHRADTLSSVPAANASSTSHSQPASVSQSVCPKPRVVSAGVPMRRPEVTKGERGSFGTEFLFAVMRARSRPRPRPCRCRAGRTGRSASGGCRCRRTRCDSRVAGSRPPWRARWPPPGAGSPEGRRQRFLECHRLGGDHMHQRPALDAGKTAESSFLQKSSSCPRQDDAAARPRSVLCVVLVTTCACGSGLGYTPAATSPATCAMSTQNTAPT